MDFCLSPRGEREAKINGRGEVSVDAFWSASGTLEFGNEKREESGLDDGGPGARWKWTELLGGPSGAQAILLFFLCVRLRALAALRFFVCNDSARLLREEPQSR